MQKRNRLGVNILKPILALSLIMTQISCATIVRGTEQPLIVKTNPSGAIVTTTAETSESKRARLDNTALKKITYGCASTPCDIIVPRRSTFIAKIEKPGFIPVHITVRSHSMTETAKKAAIGTVAGGTAGATGYFFTAGGAALPFTTAGAIFSSAAITLMFAAPLTTIDALDGALLDIYPNPIDINLLPKGTIEPETGEEIIAVHIDPDNQANNQPDK